jgi:TPR repeat protein
MEMPSVPLKITNLPSLSPGEAQARCVQKDGIACAVAGIAFEQADQRLRAAAAYERGCANKSGLACALLAQMLTTSLGEVKEDVPRAIELSQPACLAGEARACGVRALLYEHVESYNTSAAKRLYTLACDAGDSGACHDMGLGWFAGRFCGRKDPGKAAEFLRRACALGVTTACTQVGMVNR